MDYSINYLGRRIEANIVQGSPVLIIDVYQKEGDCPKNYSLEKRMECEKDCQNTFLSLFVEMANRSVVGMGMLTRDAPTWLVVNLQKVGLTHEEAIEMYAAKPSLFEIVDAAGYKSVSYGGHTLVEVRDCEFATGDRIITQDPEIKPYLDFITGDIEGVLARCGITFNGPFVLNMKKNKSPLDFMRVAGRG